MLDISTLARRSQSIGALTPSMYKLLVALLVLIIVGLFLVAGLLVLRRRRRAHRVVTELPMYSDKRSSTSSTSSHHRRSRVRPSQSIHIYHEAREHDNQSCRPASPGGSVPEIRITFPEEFDDSGKRQSGRVVVVHVGDNGIGMGPVIEKLPAYQTSSERERMQSIDLERVGGLVEKEKEKKPLGW